MAIVSFILGNESVGGGYTGVFLLPPGPDVAFITMNHRMSATEVTEGGDFFWTNPAATDDAALLFTSVVGEPNVVFWAGGTWTIRMQIITGSANVTWVTARVCRINSAGTSIISVPGSNLNVALAVPQNEFLTTTVTVADSSGLGSDRVHIVCGFSSTHNNKPRRISIDGVATQTTTIDDTPGGGDVTVNQDNLIAATAAIETPAITHEGNENVDAAVCTVNAAIPVQGVGADAQVDAAVCAADATMLAATPSNGITVTVTAVCQATAAVPVHVPTFGATVDAIPIFAAATVLDHAIQADVNVNPIACTATAAVPVHAISTGSAILKIRVGDTYVTIGGTV